MVYHPKRLPKHSASHAQMSEVKQVKRSKDGQTDATKGIISLASRSINIGIFTHQPLILFHCSLVANFPSIFLLIPILPHPQPKQCLSCGYQESLVVWHVLIQRRMLTF